MRIFLKMQSSRAVKQNFPLSWKKFFSSEVTILTRIGHFENCSTSVERFSEMIRTKTNQVNEYTTINFESNKNQQMKKRHMSTS